jgi:hypothetical protein
MSASPVKTKDPILKFTYYVCWGCLGPAQTGRCSYIRGVHNSYMPATSCFESIAEIKMQSINVDVLQSVPYNMHRLRDQESNVKV